MSTQYFCNFDLTQPFSDTNAQVNVASGTPQTYTVPGTAKQYYSVRFAYTSSSNVFVSLNAAPSIPGAGTVGQQYYCEFKPGFDGSQRYVKGTDVIQFATPDTSAYVGISLRQIPG
jgi:hypothetical protein